MRNTILAAAAAFVIGGASVGALVSHAQPAPPPGVDGGPPGGFMAGGPGGGPMGMHHPGGMGPWGHHMHDGMRGGHGMRAFALVFRKADRNLSPDDVKKIAEAFLLWNGNHEWKVALDSGANTDGAIGFALTTPDGATKIATFTMDPHTGRLTRTG